MYTRLIVPLDGSDIAEHALTEATTMAALTGASLHLVRVVDLAQAERAVFGVMVDPGFMGALLREEIESAMGYLDDVKNRLTLEGLTVTTEVLRGPTTNTLVDVAQPGDLMIMASHGRSGVRRWFLGSIAEDVIRRSRVPVLLVRAGTERGWSGASVRVATQSAAPAMA